MKNNRYKFNNEVRVHKDEWVGLRMRICPCCGKHELIAGLGDLNEDVKIVDMRKRK